MPPSPAQNNNNNNNNAANPQSIVSPTTFDLPPDTLLDAAPASLKKHTLVRLLAPSVALAALCLLALLLAAIRVGDTARRMQNRIETDVVYAAEHDASGTFGSVANSTALGSLALLRRHAATIFEHEIKNKSARAHADFCTAGFVQYATATAQTAAGEADLAVTVADLASQLVWSFEQEDEHDEDSSSIAASSATQRLRSSISSADYWSVLCARKSSVSACDITSVGCVSGRTLPDSFGFTRLSNLSSSSTGSSVFSSFVVWDGGRRIMVSTFSSSSSQFEWSVPKETAGRPSLDYTSLSRAYNSSSSTTAWPAPSSSASLNVVLHTNTDAATGSAAILLESESPAAAVSVFDAVVTDKDSHVRTVSRIATSELLAKVSDTLGSRMRALSSGAASSSAAAAGATSFFVGVNGSAAKKSTTQVVVSSLLPSAARGGPGAETVAPTIIVSTWNDAPTGTRKAMTTTPTATGTTTSSFRTTAAASSSSSLSSSENDNSPLITAVALSDCISVSATSSTAFTLDSGFLAKLPPVTCGVALSWSAFAADSTSILMSGDDVKGSANNTVVGAALLATFVGLLILLVVALQIRATYKHADAVHVALVVASRIVNAAGVLDTQRLTFFETPEEIAEDEQKREEEEEAERLTQKQREQEDVQEAAAKAAAPAAGNASVSMNQSSTDESLLMSAAAAAAAAEAKGNNNNNNNDGEGGIQTNSSKKHPSSSSASKTDRRGQRMSPSSSSAANVVPNPLAAPTAAATAAVALPQSADNNPETGSGASSKDGDAGHRWGADRHSEAVLKEVLKGSFGSPRHGSAAAAVAAAASKETSAIHDSAANSSNSLQHPNADAAAIKNDTAAEQSNKRRISPTKKSKEKKDETNNNNNNNSSSMINSSNNNSSHDIKSQSAANALAGGSCPFNATERLSDITEIAHLQLRLNKLCAAAVESRTVIPAVAFDLFYSQFGSAQQRATSIEATAQEEAAFMHEIDTDSCQSHRPNQHPLHNDGGSNSPAPSQVSGGAHNTTFSLRNSPQGSPLAASTGGGGAAAALRSSSPAGDGSFFINMLDGSLSGGNIGAEVSSLLPQIKVQAEDSITSHPNASLSEHPLVEGNVSLTQNPVVGAAFGGGGAALDQSPGSESLYASVNLNSLLGNCPLRPRRNAVVLSASIAGFLQLCEDENLHDARALSQLFLNVATKWVHDNGGTLLRVNADLVVASWGAILPVVDAELKAAMCAMDISETLSNMRTKLHYNFEWTCIVLSGAVVAGSAGTVAEKTSVIRGRVMDLLDELPSLMTALKAPVVITQEVRDRVLPPNPLASTSNTRSSMHQHWHAFPIDKLSLCTLEQPDTVFGEVRLFELRMGPAKEYVRRVEAGFTSLVSENNIPKACEQLQRTISDYVEETASDQQLLRLYRLALWSHVRGEAYVRATPLWQRNLAELAFSVNIDDDPFANAAASMFMHNSTTSAAGGNMYGNNTGNSSHIHLNATATTARYGNDDENIGPSSGSASMNNDGAEDHFTPNRMAGSHNSGHLAASTVMGQSQHQQQQHLSPFGAPGSRRYEMMSSRRRSTHIDDTLRQQLLTFSASFVAPKASSRVASRMSRSASPMLPGGGGEASISLLVPARAPSRAGSSLGVHPLASSGNSGGGGIRSRSVSFMGSNSALAAAAAAGSPSSMSNSSFNNSPQMQSPHHQPGSGSPAGAGLASPLQQPNLLMRSPSSSPRATPLPLPNSNNNITGAGAGAVGMAGNASLFSGGKKESPTASVNFGMAPPPSSSGIFQQRGSVVPTGGTASSGSPLAGQLKVSPPQSNSPSSNFGSPSQFPFNALGGVGSAERFGSGSGSVGSSPRESPAKRPFNTSLTGMPPLISVTGAHEEPPPPPVKNIGPTSPKIAPLNAAQLAQQQQQHQQKARRGSAPSIGDSSNNNKIDFSNTANTLATSMGSAARLSSGSPDQNQQQPQQQQQQLSPSPPRLNASSASLSSPLAVNPNRQADAATGAAGAAANSSSPLRGAQGAAATALSSSVRGGSHASGSAGREAAKSFMIKDKKGLMFRVAETSCLGKGAFGEVFMGLTETGCPVAVKIVNVPGVDEASREAAAAAAAAGAAKKKTGVAARRAERKGLATAKSDDVLKAIELVLIEVTVLSQLRHDNIVGYISSAVLRHYDPVTRAPKTKLAVIMEFIPGGSLASLLHKMKGPLNEQTAVHYLRDILLGLKFLHGEGFIHRDLKPGNVLLLSDGSCKLTDFGTTVSIGKLARGREADMMGTPQYMAPEACRGETPTMATDVWAFGIVMAEILSGAVPWPVEEGVPFMPIRFIYQVGHKDDMVPQVKNNPLIPPEAARIIMRCCQRDQLDRPTVDDILDMDYFKQVDARLSRGMSNMNNNINNSNNNNNVGSSSSPVNNHHKTNSSGSNTTSLCASMNHGAGSLGATLVERSFNPLGIANATAGYGRSPTRSLPSNIRSPIGGGGGFGSNASINPGNPMTLGASLRVPTAAGGVSPRSPRSHSPGEVASKAGSAEVSGQTTPNHDRRSGSRSGAGAAATATTTAGGTLAVGLSAALQSHSNSNNNSNAPFSGSKPSSSMTNTPLQSKTSGRDDDDEYLVALTDTHKKQRGSGSLMIPGVRQLDDQSDVDFMDDDAVLKCSAATAAASASSCLLSPRLPGLARRAHDGNTPQQDALFELMSSGASSKRTSFYDGN